MERQRGTTVAIVAALVIAVISLGVAFAAFSTTLNINGTATVQTSSWDIYFTSANQGSKPGTGGISMPTANIGETNFAGATETASGSGTIEATTITWNATFKTPGDKVVYTIYVKNAGSYNAKVNGINLGTKTCTLDTTNTPAETTVCGHIHYGLYTDNPTNPASATALDNTFTVDSNTTGVIYLIAWLDNSGWAEDGSDLPSNNVITNTIQSTVTFEQTN